VLVFVKFTQTLTHKLTLNHMAKSVENLSWIFWCVCVKLLRASPNKSDYVKQEGMSLFFLSSRKKIKNSFRFPGPCCCHLNHRSPSFFILSGKKQKLEINGLDPLDPIK
jgi:hypothetical protein